jgi:DNA-binding PadR family transcriptional regulator
LKTLLEPSVQERMLRAFMDLVILRLLLHQPMTAYEIDNSILKKFDGKRGPNVVYTRLASLERNGLINCAQTKHSRVYNITDKGRKIVDETPIIIKEMQTCPPILLGS